MRTLVAEQIQAGMTISDGGNRFKVRHVDHHVRVRNIGEFARPAPGKVWFRNHESQTWIVDCGSEWPVVG